MYLREDSTPYYVGKGKNKRYKEKHTVSIPSLDRIVIVKDSLTDEEAIALEIELIKFYGRKDIKTGILRNLTDGGEGSNPGPETRKRMSIAKQNYTPWNKGLKTGPISENTKKVLSESATRRWSKSKKQLILNKCNWCGEEKAKNKYCSNSCRASHYAKIRSENGINGFQNKSNQDAAQKVRRPVLFRGGTHTQVD
jgi:hypothetical protein